MPIEAILTFWHSVTPKLTPPLTPVTTKSKGILPDPRQVSVPSFKLIALKCFELCCSDPKIDPRDPKTEPSDPKMDMHFA